MSRATYPKESIHKEKVIQDHIIEELVSKQGYRQGKTEDYDRALALDKELLLEFIQNTQADSWRKLEEYYPASAETEFFKQLERAFKQRGALDVIRRGIKLVPNIAFELCFFKPASSLNEELVTLYDSNILSITPELEYSLKNANRIDLVIFVNGIPLATLECKNPATGSNFKRAEKQYCRDRPPAGEALLTFKRGALVHFALDEDNVSMSTKLANGNTRFLPFNRGFEQGAGNPDIEGEFPIAYLYCDQPESKAVFSREILLDIIGRFMLLEIFEGEQILTFPRFHQLDAVLKLIEHAKSHGAGQNYLIQHSAGSGKSNTIAWTAHRLISLHDEHDKSVFDTVIVVTDRVVLDRQLQDTVARFEQTQGLVKKIDGASRQLKEAIEQGARIIITTIQKFSTDYLKEVSGQSRRRFAILVDEAHSSQSGKSADSLVKALTRENSKKAPNDIEDLIADYQKKRGPQSNISYFAFTATPRNVTLERFGIKDSNGLPRPFHLYSMKQAIEEGFILDVLQNYITYKAYYELEKAIQDDPKLRSRRGKRQVARFASLHPTAIFQKVEVIVEHFRRHILGELGGWAKAMLVTQSREHAIRYYHAITKYIKENKYDGIRALVAFSGEKELDGHNYTEAGINTFSETQLPEKFDSPEYQLLIVAEKYQTGFDQPKLCAMYIDRKLEALQTVQTLSRLNRTEPRKRHTFILDFQNTMEEIQSAFRPYYETTFMEETSDPNQIYQLSERIESFSIIDKDELSMFAERFYQDELSSQDRTFLQRYIKTAVQRFNDQEDEKKQEEFRQLLKSYTRFYSFISQIVSLQDTYLEKLFSYSSWLFRFLPSRKIPPDIEITDDMLSLKKFRIEEKERGGVSLPFSAPKGAPLSPIKDFGANPYTKDEKRALSEIVKDFNRRNGTEFTDEDLLKYNRVREETLKDEELREVLAKNPSDVVSRTFTNAFYKEAIRLLQRENQLNDIFMNDEVSRNKMIEFQLKLALKELRVA